MKIKSEPVETAIFEETPVTMEIDQYQSVKKDPLEDYESEIVCKVEPGLAEVLDENEAMGNEDSAQDIVMDIKIEPEQENAEYWEATLLVKENVKDLKTEYGIPDIVAENAEYEESASGSRSNYEKSDSSASSRNSTDPSANIHESIKHNWLFCLDCDSSFEEQKLLKRHLEFPHNFKCNKCTKSFIYIHELDNHKKVLKHFDQCTKCNNIYDSHSDLEQHNCKVYDSLTETQTCYESLNIIDEVKSQCHKSSYSFRPIKNKILEIPLNMTNQLKFKCEQCKKFIDYSTANVRKHNSVTHIGCEKCNNVFEWDDLSSNVGYVGMNNRVEFHCTKCSEVFKWDETREKQAFLDLKIRYQCVKCDMLFTGRKNLDLHVEVLHTSSFSCVPCNRLFAVKDDLRKHISKMHVQCQSCNNIFSWTNIQSNVTMNYINYRAEFLCIKCDQIFGWDENRKREAAMVLKPKFRCDKCGKLYQQKSELDKHIKDNCIITYSYARRCKKTQSQCRKCNNIFTWDNLESNVSMNEKAKLQCIKCNHVFKWDKSRKMQATLALKILFQCVECSLSFKLKKNLDRHIASHHI